MCISMRSLPTNHFTSKRKLSKINCYMEETMLSSRLPEHHSRGRCPGLVLNQQFVIMALMFDHHQSANPMVFS